MKDTNGKKIQKISLLSTILMGIGAIIGAGVFATTPIGAKIIGGNGVVIGFLFASVFVFIKTFPEMVMTSALPASGASYMHLTRLVHPMAGAVTAFNLGIIGIMRIASMALTFCTYFALLVPGINTVLVAVTVVVIFTILSTIGLKLSTWIQNISVAILLIALGMYVTFGWGSCKISIYDAITTTFELGKMWAAMGVLHGSLIGANAIMYVADEVKNPGKNIPLAFIISTIFTAILYAIIAYVTVAVQPNVYAIDNLVTVGKEYLGQGQILFFISGGALLAVITSINACILAFSRLNLVAARDRLFPKAMAKINKFGVPAVSIWVNSIITILALVIKLNLTNVINIVSVAMLIITPIVFASLFIVPKRYPNAYKAAWLKLPHWLNCTLAIIATILSFVMGGYVLKQMDQRSWIIMVAYYGGSIIYTLLRGVYLKKKEGIDLMDQMRKPHEPWNKLEEESRLKLQSK